MTKKKRTYNANLIKETLSYSTNEMAKRFNIHKRTVQEWYRAGLPRIDNRKPSLVLGADLKDFLKTRLNKRKNKCRKNELYCLKCKVPRQSWNNVVDIRFLSKIRLMIIGLCAQCNTKTNKIASIKNLADVSKIFAIQQIHNRDLVGSDIPSFNTDIREVNER